MTKYKFTILFAVLFTVPLCGYFIINGYWWLFDGNNPIANKMFTALFFGFLAGMLNFGIFVVESEQDND